MKRAKNIFLSIIAGVSLLLIAPLTQGQQTTVTTEPFGFLTTTLIGGSMNTLGLNMLRPVVIQSVITDFGPTTITDSNSNFTSVLSEDDYYFVEIISGQFKGSTLNLESWTADTLTLGGIDNLSSILTGGEGYRIREHWTIAKVFGPNNEIGLDEGGSTGSADSIYVPDGKGGFTLIFYANGGFPGVGWRAAGEGTTDFSNHIIWFTDGLFIRRLPSDPLDIRVVGNVKTDVTILAVEEGFNYFSSIYPSGLETVGNIGLYDENNPECSLHSGGSGTADVVYVDQGGAFFNLYYYSNGGFAGIGWRLVGGGTVDRANDPIPPTGTLIIKKRGVGPLNLKLKPLF